MINLEKQQEIGIIFWLWLVKEIDNGSWSYFHKLAFLGNNLVKTGWFKRVHKKSLILLQKSCMYYTYFGGILEHVIQGGGSINPSYQVYEKGEKR